MSRLKISGLQNEVIEAQDKLRKEIAAELHDNFGQLLISAQLLLELEVRSDIKEPSVTLLRALEIIKEAVTALRDISHDLYDGTLEKLDLKKSLNDLVQTIALTNKLRITVKFHNYFRLKKVRASIVLSVYRIIQEHITNILRHSKATETSIHLFATNKSLDVEIFDNGQGFNKHNVRVGLGLKNIYNRTAKCNGMVYIDTAPGRDVY